MHNEGEIKFLRHKKSTHERTLLAWTKKGKRLGRSMDLGVRKDKFLVTAPQQKSEKKGGWGGFLVWLVEGSKKLLKR